MNLLVTGANGFMGRNLCEALLRRADSVMKVDVDTPPEMLEQMAQKADFVFHLAGVNRPRAESEFLSGNRDFTETLMQLLETGRKPPVLMSGSTQAALDNPYGHSKKLAEEALFAYAKRTGSPVYPYRLTNAFGKWSRPNYNSAVATFCYNTARGLPITVSDPQRMMQLNYIDDIVAEFLHALEGCPTPGGDGYFCVLPEHSITLGKIVELLTSFRNVRETLNLPDGSDGFTKKLYATYLSFLPEDGFAYTPLSHEDARGSFTELFHMGGYGQVSINLQKPHVLKGEHWHDTKHEKFVVVSGHGVICFRKATGGEVIRYEVDGSRPTVVEIPPGYTHNIENLGETDMVTLMWASETFDPNRPDTYRLPVKPDENGRCGQ